MTAQKLSLEYNTPHIMPHTLAAPPAITAQTALPNREQRPHSAISTRVDPQVTNKQGKGKTSHGHTPSTMRATSYAASWTCKRQVPQAPTLPSISPRLAYLDRARTGGWLLLLLHAEEAAELAGGASVCTSA